MCVSNFSGAAKAKGKVITFLDAHCEATEGWLEPLMAEIHKDRLVRSSFQQMKYMLLNFEVQKTRHHMVGGLGAEVKKLCTVN